MQSKISKLDQNNQLSASAKGIKPVKCLTQKKKTINRVLMENWFQVFTVYNSENCIKKKKPNSIASQKNIGLFFLNTIIIINTPHTREKKKFDKY